MTPVIFVEVNHLGTILTPTYFSAQKTRRFGCVFHVPWQNKINYCFGIDLSICLSLALASEDLMEFFFFLIASLFVFQRFERFLLISRKLTYPTCGKGKSFCKVPLHGDIFVPWRVV